MIWVTTRVEKSTRMTKLTTICHFHTFVITTQKSYTAKPFTTKFFLPRRSKLSFVNFFSFLGSLSFAATIHAIRLLRSVPLLALSWQHKAMIWFLNLDLCVCNKNPKLAIRRNFEDLQVNTLCKLNKVGIGTLLDTKIRGDKVDDMMKTNFCGWNFHSSSISCGSVSGARLLAVVESVKFD
ncbi:hypothetical protein F8388_003557 [Cannabis sativa]|uniref:Uncharacterized protein n=1 Tax=Cannabis sativa TaxID=3483 RepID=A0A7J6EMC8_CANSA|nr:hypothetical protein F8388_003557 [Cannabis sativa]